MKNITVIGLGLIGGSILKGLKETEDVVMGFDKDNQLMKRCYKESLISNHDRALSDILKETDLLILCLYPEAIIDFIKQHQHDFKKASIVTDVAGLKSNFMDEISRVTNGEFYFIGGHPMAGKEGIGFDSSSSSIFINANYLLIADDSIPEKCYKILVEVIKSLGCGHIEYLNPTEHDELIAYTSHMPHILASTLVNCNRFEKTASCVAGSYKEITRVAEINETLWTELFLENKKALLEEINLFKETLSQLEDHIEKDAIDQIKSFLSTGRKKKIQLKA